MRLAMAILASCIACGPAHHDVTPAASEKPDLRTGDRRVERETHSASPSSSPTAPQATAAARVTRVIDGDTIDVTFDDPPDDDGRRGRPRGRRQARTQRVRLLGVDTPEAHPGPKLDRDARRRRHDEATILALGQKATAYTRERLNRRNIRLEFDVRERDKYGRLLAWVWLEDGTLFNAALVRDGYARTLTIPPNVKYSKQLRGLEREARQQKRGLWGDGM